MRARSPSRALLAWLSATALVPLLGCSSGVRRFPLREPLTRDTDLRSVYVPCRPAPSKDDPRHVECTPEPYVSPLAWDMADNTVFRPLAQVFAVSPGGEAVNVNALDEVPDSSWFENRIGQRPMTPDEIFRGPCSVLLDEKEWPDGSWRIDEGKPNGATPGFRVRVPEYGKFMLKADPKEQPERASAASAIGMRLYHAVGFHVPCDAVVYFPERFLKLTPGLVATDNTGIPRAFDDKALRSVLVTNSRRGDRMRMQSSQWVSGRVLGPFKYEGTRSDDPNDVIPHQDRRELRGARLLAAWVNHFDAREQNTMTTWIADDRSRPDSSPGHVRHYYLDVSEVFGSEWDWDGISRRLGHSYYLDFAHVSQDFITLGLLSRPWDRAVKGPSGEVFGYFRGEDFVPEDWHDGYPNPSFDRMTEHDGAWMARILARITPPLLEAAVKAGNFSQPRHERYLIDTLLERRRRILHRYLARLSPLTQPRVSGRRVCVSDRARESQAFEGASFRYDAHLYRGERLEDGGVLRISPDPGGSPCFDLPEGPVDRSPDDSAARYRIVDMTNGQARWPLRMHFYDLGAGGLRLVGLERPESAGAPE